MSANSEYTELIYAQTGATMEDVTPQEARWILWHFGAPGGLEPGSFTKPLMQAIANADPVNLRRCAQGFPGLAFGIALVQRTEQGLSIIEAVAEGKDQ